jgi:hypothetical protein
MSDPYVSGSALIFLKRFNAESLFPICASYVLWQAAAYTLYITRSISFMTDEFRNTYAG